MLYDTTCIYASQLHTFSSSFKPCADGQDCQRSTGVIKACVLCLGASDKHDVPVMVKGPLVLQVFHEDVPTMYKPGSLTCMDFLMDLTRHQGL